MGMITKTLDINVAGELVSSIHEQISENEIAELFRNIILEVESLTDELDVQAHILPNELQNVRDMISVMAIDRSLNYMAEGGLMLLIRRLNSRHFGLEVTSGFKHIEMLFDHDFVQLLDRKQLLMHVIWVVNAFFRSKYTMDEEFRDNLLYTGIIFGREISRFMSPQDLSNFATATIIPNLLILFLRP